MARGRLCLAVVVIWMLSGTWPVAEGAPGLSHDRPMGWSSGASCSAPAPKVVAS
jgi:hypothetical protein